MRLAQSLPKFARQRISRRRSSTAYPTAIHLAVSVPFHSAVRARTLKRARSAGLLWVTVTPIGGNQFFDLTVRTASTCLATTSTRTASPGQRTPCATWGRSWAPTTPVPPTISAGCWKFPAGKGISFHMSGTEAVMQAVAPRPYHTSRSHLVRFCGALPRLVGDVQPGVGNPIAARETYTLKIGRGGAQVLRPARTSHATWSIHCRRCISMSARPAIHAGRQRTQRPLRPAAYSAWLHSCVPCAASAVSC